MGPVFSSSSYFFNLYALPPLLVGSMVFLLGFGTLIWERAERVSRSFFFMTSSAAVWLTAYGIAFLARSSDTAMVWINVSHLGVSFIPSFVFLFSLILVGRFQDFRFYTALNFSLSLFFYLWGLKTHSWITDLASYFWGYYPRYGTTAVFFLIFFFITLFASLVLLWQGYRRTPPGRSRSRLKTFLFAFLVGYFACIDYLPNFGIPIYPIGYIAVLAFVAMASYAIRHYHLIDITPAFAAHQILDTMQGAVLVTDMNGIIRVVNKTACQLFGYEEKEAIGMPVTRIVGTAVVGEIRNYGIAWHAKDGRKVHVNMSASPLKGAQGTIEGMVYVAIDITELKTTTEELLKVNVALEAENRQHQKTQEILKESEERFRSIAESANDAIISANSEGRIISWNKGARQIFGYEEKEVLLRPLTMLMPERFREAHQKGLERLAATGESRILGKTLELAGIRKNGEEFPLELSLSSWKTAKGIFYSGIMRDISERKRMAEERDRFFNLSLDMLCIADYKGYFQQLNPGWEKTLGWTLDELMAKPYIEFVHPEDRQATLEEAQKAVAGGGVWTFENRYLCKDGSYKWLLWNAIPLPEKGLIYSAARDITERKKAKEMRLRLAAIVESTDDAIIGMNLNGVVMSWNRGAEKIYGYLAGEMIGKSFTVLVPESYSEEIQGILNRIWEGGRLENYETKRMHKDGRLIDVSLTISPIKDDGGRITGISYIGRDITKLKQAEEALRQKKNLELKSEFISMVSHELRTPLTAIKMGIDILMVEEAGPVNSEQKDWLGMAQRNVERLTRLINNVLDFQKLDAGEMPYDLKEQDLNHLIWEHEKTIRSLAHNKDLTFEFNLSEDLPKIAFDREKISEVLMNLAGNAVKFTDKGKIILKSEKKDGMVEVSVTDTGIGIRESDVPKLFTHFTQVHGDHTKTGGTGLGLAISKKIVEQHQGRIGVKSEFGKGSTFYFRLPLLMPAVKKN